MKVITFAGAHACGKTAVILKTAELLAEQGMVTGVMKLDCIASEDDRIYGRAGIPVVKYLSGNTCPDHYFASRICEVFDWGKEQELDILITESAGLCGRCAPHIREIPAVCVIDSLSGITAPFKAGPMLKYADYIVVTKGDLVSPAEREVFYHHIRMANSRAGVSFINGLSGQGAYRLADFISRAEPVEEIQNSFLRFSMPAAVCTFCSGQMKVGVSGPGGRIKWQDKKRTEEVSYDV
jgi:Ni2+-binding GTPase involved in maturation of urease and hydrogenase